MMNKSESMASESSESRFFMAGLRILVVDDDPTCLRIVREMLMKCKYQVTTCERATVAMSILRERKGRFDLVLTDVHMPDMDGFKLLELIGLELDLPVIMMSADRELKIALKGLEHGACYYLTKPVCYEELKNLWQHVVRKMKAGQKENDQMSCVGENESKELEEDCASQMNDENKQKRKKEASQEDEEDDGEGENEDYAPQKRARVIWHQALHNEFLKAVNELGIDKAVPKKILERMKIPGLARENVASHLQKYRLFLRRLNPGQYQPKVSSLYMSGSPQSSFTHVSPLKLFDIQDPLGHKQFIDYYNLSSLQPAFSRPTHNINAPMAILNQEAQSNRTMMTRLHYGQMMSSQGNLNQALPGSTGNLGSLGLERQQMRMVQSPHGIGTMQMTNQTHHLQQRNVSDVSHDNLLPNIQAPRDLSSISSAGSFGASHPSLPYNVSSNCKGLLPTTNGALYGPSPTVPITDSFNATNLNSNMIDISNKGKEVMGSQSKDLPNPLVNEPNFGYSNRESASFDVLRSPMFGSSSMPPQFDEAHLEGAPFEEEQDEFLDANFGIATIHMDNDEQCD